MSSSNDRQGSGPHQNQPVATTGAPLDTAEGAAILVHGRGATAQGMLGLARELHYPGVAFLAPQAADRTWYPNSFLALLEHNEPKLSSGLQAIADVLETVTDAGVPAERTVLIGFSQGACLALEFTARNTRRYGGVAGLSGGLIGPEGTPREYGGSLEGASVFLGCSDVDQHIPLDRVHETADVLGEIEGDVTERIYQRMGHTINEDELASVRELLERVLSD